MAQEFITSCLIMGLGIGIDVAIATFVRASAMTNKHTAIKWVVGVSATHTLFPMIGYLLTYFSLQVMPIITPIIGMLAFSLIVFFLFEEMKNINQPSESDRGSFIGWVLILAVSWDALWSGPAKSAQVSAWPDWIVYCSFLLVGVFVTMFCLFSLYLGKRMFQKKNINSWQSQKYLNFGQWVQYSVIAYFGLLALVRYTFSSSMHAGFILLFSFAFIYWTLRVLRREKTYRSTAQEC